MCKLFSSSIYNYLNSAFSNVIPFYWDYGEFLIAGCIFAKKTTTNEADGMYKISWSCVY